MQVGQLYGNLQAILVVAIATTFDDNIYLTGFFSETDRRFRPAHVIAGELIGFSVLMVISLVLSRFVANVVPMSVIGWLGMFPIIIGVSSFVQLFRDRAERDQNTAQTNGLRAQSERREGFELRRLDLRDVLSDRKTYVVSGVTVSNGGNNLAIYVPLMGNSSFATSIAVVASCYFAVLCWLLLSFNLTRMPGIAVILSRYANRIFPFLLMWLGFRILGDSGAIRLSL